MEQRIKKKEYLLRHNTVLLRRRLWLGAALLVSVLIFIVFLSLIMPWTEEKALCRSFRQGLQAKVVQADIGASSAWHLLIGKSESIDLMMEFDDSSLLTLALLHAHWGPSNVALALMRRGKGGERDAEPTATELYWDESRLATYLNKVQREVLVSQVQINAEQVEIYGSIMLNGGRHNIYLAGSPQSNDIGQVVFKASEWRAEGLTPTEQLKESICEALSYEPDLSPLAWKVWAKQVELSPGQMRVYGSSSCCH